MIRNPGAAPSATIARELANVFTSLKRVGVTDRTIYNQILRQTLENHPEFWGVWSVWKPNALDGCDRDYVNQAGHDATGRYAPLWNRTKQGFRLEPNVGYDTPGLGDYFLIPVRRGQETFFSPYEYRPVDGRPRIITSQVAPIFHQGECVGVAGFDVMVRDQEPDRGAPVPRVLSKAGTDRCPPLPGGLTRREQEVLDWLSEGKANSEIGLILGISAHTVKHHVEKIFSKLGVENRQSAMLCALQPYVRRNAGARSTPLVHA